MGRIAIVGDVGGHSEQLRWVLRWLGARDSRLPEDLTVVQVGDLVDRGPDSVAVLDEVERVAGRWVQLLGNHEAQYLPGNTVFWPEPLAGDEVARLREWWSAERFGVASAVRTADGDELLVTHAGLTVAAWQELGEPGSAAEAAALLNQRPPLIWEVGAHGRDERAGPLWAESGAALHEPWLAYRGVVPFGQVHGHSALVRYTDRQWRCAGRVRQRATVDWHARHVRVRIGGRVFTGVDPCHGKTGADKWEPLVLNDATILT